MLTVDEWFWACLVLVVDGCSGLVRDGKHLETFGRDHANACPVTGDHCVGCYGTAVEIW